jgi:hypothetical protein
MPVSESRVTERERNTGKEQSIDCRDGRGPGGTWPAFAAITRLDNNAALLSLQDAFNGWRLFVGSTDITTVERLHWPIQGMHTCYTKSAHKHDGAIKQRMIVHGVHHAEVEWQWWNLSPD